MGSYILFRLAGFLAPLIPRRLGYAIMGWAARLIYRTSPAKRVMIQSNVRHVLGSATPEAEIDRVSRRIFHNLLKNYFDLFWLPAQPTEEIARLVTIHGFDNAAEALKLNKGMLAVTMHLGNQELMTQLRSFTDYTTTIVAERIKPERVFQYLVSLRQHSGLHIVPIDGALREIVRAVKRNEVVGLVYDRDVTNSGRIVSFFGSPACLPDGYAILALKYGVPIVPGAVVRQPDDTYAAYLTPPLLFEGKANNDEDVQRVMLAVGKVLEEFAVKYIDQWVYFHYVWEDDKERVKGDQTVSAES